MDLSVISLLALLAAILIGSFTAINVGLISIALAFAVGVGLAGMKHGAVIAGFPANLFVTLLGVTFLFSQARVNGTLERVASSATWLARGRAGMVPVIFFLLALLFASIGPGNIAAVALLAPVAMAAAGRAAVPAFLMAIMVCSGANAGAFSPIAPTGIIANELMAKIGLPNVAWQNYFNAFIAQSFVGFAGYLLFGGARLFVPGTMRLYPAELMSGALDVKQRLTVLIVCLLVAAVLLLKVDVTIGAFVAAAVMSLTRAADEKAAFRDMPWAVIVMVCGMTMLVNVVDKAGGLELFTGVLAKVSDPITVTGVMAFVTGVISVYSSSSAVVLPTFLPTIPSLIEKLGGGDPIAIAASINVGAHLVDISPLSTLGALCIANAAPEVDRKRLFNQMLAWGLSMSVVGALVCYVFFGLLR
jgi:di/tricarboxylate transporter